MFPEPLGENFIDIWKLFSHHTSPHRPTSAKLLRGYSKHDNMMSWGRKNVFYLIISTKIKLQYLQKLFAIATVKLHISWQVWLGQGKKKLSNINILFLCKSLAQQRTNFSFNSATRIEFVIRTMVILGAWLTFNGYFIMNGYPRGSRLLL